MAAVFHGAKTRVWRHGMDSAQSKTKFAQWVLERNLAWISSAEVKTSVIVAVSTAMLGGVGAAFSAAPPAARTDWAYVALTITVICLTAAIVCAAWAVLPRTTGPSHSLVFFGRIATTDETLFKERFLRATEEDLLEDLLSQVHRNSQIAAIKFAWVRKSMWWSYLSVAPWFAAIMLLTRR